MKENIFLHDNKYFFHENNLRRNKDKIKRMNKRVKQFEYNQRIEIVRNKIVNYINVRLEKKDTFIL